MTSEAENQEIPSTCPTDEWGCTDECDVQEYSLVRQCDVLGLLHCHTDYADGAHSLGCIVDTARALGLGYVGITDKARVKDDGSGLCTEGIACQRAEIAQYNEESRDVRLLHGVEVEADADGSLPMDDEVLERFDYVVATLFDTADLDRKEATGRALHTVMNPYVNVLGHPCGEWMTSGSDLPLDLDVLLEAAAKAGVAIEIDANPAHEDLDWSYCYRAQELGVAMVIASDAHRAARLGDYRHGVELVRQAGLCCRQILNTRSLDDVRAFFARS